MSLLHAWVGDFNCRVDCEVERWRSHFMVFISAVAGALPGGSGAGIAFSAGRVDTFHQLTWAEQRRPPQQSLQRVLATL